MKSILIKDTTREEREAIIRASLDCGGGCENCSACSLGGGNIFEHLDLVWFLELLKKRFRFFNKIIYVGQLLNSAHIPEHIRFSLRQPVIFYKFFNILLSCES